VSGSFVTSNFLDGRIDADVMGGNVGRKERCEMQTEF
jgi:hypothetical protein